ncbi:hypothetical protein EYF80_029897 [Liparis tanakae]|uniref:Uncharacterized protein n=1 Tax=Liparis tanakae TaxID=230148 RepID=A0A4Z2H1U5_9TELE|nr:hypothetical protein EYF80_029897 [Liparis tanakae]
METMRSGLCWRREKSETEISPPREPCRSTAGGRMPGTRGQLVEGGRFATRIVTHAHARAVQKSPLSL